MRKNISLGLSLMFCFGVLFISLFSFGCTNPNPINNSTNNGTNGTVNNSTNANFTPIGSEENVLLMIYDPRMPASTQQELISAMNNVAKELKIKAEPRCMDYNIIKTGQPSDASEICRNQNEEEFEDTLNFIQNHPVTSSFFMYNDGKAISIMPSQVNIKFAHNICDSLTGTKPDSCNSIPKVPVIDAILIDNSSYNSTGFLSQMDSYGLPISLKTSEDIGSDIEKYKLDYLPAIVIIGDSVTDQDQKGLCEMMVSGGLMTKSGNDYVIYPSSDNQEYLGQKYDSVDMDVYVVSYCPYGRQMENAVLPVKKLLGDKLNLTIKFISAMHGQKEAEENLRQYCIQESQKDKFWDYLTCFNGGTDAETCLNSTGINTTMVDACMANTTQQTIAADAASKRIYSSPTTYLQGQKYDKMPRTPEQIKEIVCERLNDDGLCDTDLSSGASTVPSGHCG